MKKKRPLIAWTLISMVLIVHACAPQGNDPPLTLQTGELFCTLPTPRNQAVSRMTSDSLICLYTVKFKNTTDKPMRNVSVVIFFCAPDGTPYHLTSERERIKAGQEAEFYFSILASSPLGQTVLRKAVSLSLEDVSIALLEQSLLVYFTYDGGGLVELWAEKMYFFLASSGVIMACPIYEKIHDDFDRIGCFSLPRNTPPPLDEDIIHSPEEEASGPVLHL